MASSSFCGSTSEVKTGLIAACTSVRSCSKKAAAKKRSDHATGTSQKKTVITGQSRSAVEAKSQSQDRQEMSRRPKTNPEMEAAQTGNSELKRSPEVAKAY